MTLVVRGGRDTPDKLRGHVSGTAHAWSRDGQPLLGISVFAVLGEPLDDLLRRRFAAFARSTYAPRAGWLRLWKSCQDMTPGVQVRKRAGLLQHADDRGPGVGQCAVVAVRVQPLAGLARAGAAC